MKLKQGIREYETPPIGKIESIAISVGGLSYPLVLLDEFKMHEILSDSSRRRFAAVPNYFCFNCLESMLILWPTPDKDDYELIIVFYPPLQRL